MRLAWLVLVIGCWSSAPPAVVPAGTAPTAPVDATAARTTPDGVQQPNDRHQVVPGKPFTLEIFGLETRSVGSLQSPVADILSTELRDAARRYPAVSVATPSHLLLDEKIMHNCDPRPPCPPNNCNAPPCMFRVARAYGRDRLIYGWVTINGAVMDVELTMIVPATSAHFEWSISGTPTSTANLPTVAQQAIAGLLSRAP